MRELNIKIAKHLGWVYITHLQLKEMKKSDKKLNKAFKPGWYYYLPIDIDKLIESAYICRNHNQLSFITTDLNYLIKALDKETLHYEISKETNFRNEFYMCIAKEEVTTGNTLYEVIYKILGKLL
jgi:hypothetical protein